MALLQYDFRAVGVANVERAIAGIERRAVASMNRVARATGATSARQASAPRAATAARTRAADFHTHMARARTAAVAKQHSQELAAERRFAREKVAIARRAAREAARAEAVEAARVRGNRRNFARATVGTAGRSVGGLVSGVGSVGGSMLALGGGFAVAGAINDTIRNEKLAGKLANQAFRESGEGSGVSREAWRKKFIATATKAGAGGEGTGTVLEGMSKFQALTGDTQTNLGIAQRAVDVATATGADVADVFSVAGETMLVMQQRGIKGAAALKQVDEVLMALAAQGKLGSIEFADLATSMGKLGASTDAYKGDVVDLVTTMGAMAQIGKRGGASNVEEATTALMRMRDDMIGNASRFKAQGVDVFTRNDQGTKTGIRHPLEVLAETMRKNKGDIEKTGKLFGTRGAKVASPFFGMARELGGGDVGKGIELALEEFNTFRKARTSEKELKDSAAARRKQADMQLAAAAQQFNAAIGKELLPTLTKLVPAFTKLIPEMAKAAEHVTKFVNALTEKPLTTIGAVIASKLVLDLASAGIGAAVKQQLIALLASSRVPVPTGGPGGATPPVVAGGGKGILGKLAPVAAATGVAGLITAVGHGAVGALDEQIGSSHKLSSALPGRTKDGGFSFGEMLKDLAPVYGQIRVAQRAGDVLGGIGQEAGVFKGGEPPQIERVGAAGEKLVDAAAKLAAAGDKLAAVQPNRGDAPKTL